MSSDPTPASSIDEKREPAPAAADLEGGHLGRTDSEIEKDGGGMWSLTITHELLLTYLRTQRFNSSAPMLLPLASRPPPME